MPARKKSRFENFFSWKRHKRRIGAKRLVSIESDFKELKQQRIDEGEVVFTHGSSHELADHLDHLRNEFRGRTELEFYHAKLNVLLRREYKVKETFRKLEYLWQCETPFLLSSLNTRWIMSAADSYLDHSEDPEEQAHALTVSFLVNTIKLYETERFLCEAEEMDYKEERIQYLKSKRLSLYDGTSGFAIGTDDTLRNMRWRMDKVATDSVVGAMLREVFTRLQKHETVYKRFKERHHRKRTAWW